MMTPRVRAFAAAESRSGVTLNELLLYPRTIIALARASDRIS
jgi:hypothetical protein